MRLRYYVIYGFVFLVLLMSSAVRAQGVTKEDILLLQATQAMERGDAVTGKRYVDQVLAVNPNNADALVLMGTILLQDGDGRSAKTYFLRAVKVDPTNDNTWIQLAAIAQEIEGNSNQALEYAMRALQINPRNDSVYTMMANIYAEQGKYDVAIDFFKRAYQIAPEDPTNLYGMGLCYESKSELLKAQQLLERAQMLNHDSVFATHIQGALMRIRQKRTSR